MRKFILVVTILIWAAAAFAGGTEYRIRADGLACPYCAYGVEKKFKKIQGVETFSIDLEKGLVIVTVAEGVELTEPQMKKLFRDAGFTFRSMKKTPL